MNEENSIVETMTGNIYRNESDCVDVNTMNEKLNHYDEKMKKTMANLERELATIRAGRANPNVLNKIMVDYY